MDARLQTRSPTPRLLMYHFGGFTFDSGRGSLSGAEGKVISLRPKAAEVLCYLAERAGRVIPREELMEAVWGDVFVTDDSVTQCVAEIRRALGEKGARLLQTLPKRGYLLATEVTQAEARSTAAAVETAAPPTPQPADENAAAEHRPELPAKPVRYVVLATSLALLLCATAAGWVYRDHLIGRLMSPPTKAPSTALHEFGLASAPRLSVVVLPFTNLGGDPKDDYLADGVTDDLTTALSNIKDTFVIARNSAYTYKGKPINVKDVGKELGVRYVFEGSIRRLGDLLRVNAQLVSAETGAYLRADRFDEPIKDLPAGQEEIVQRLGGALGWEMLQLEAARSFRERPDNPDAFDLVLRARSLLDQPFNVARMSQAQVLLEQAVLLDPSSIQAKTRLAYTLIELSFDLPERSPYALVRASDLLSEAESLNANSQSVLTVRAFLFRGLRRWPEAMASAQRLIDLYPNNEEGYNHLAFVKMITGAAEEAIPLFKRSIQLDPRSAYLNNRYRRIGYCLLVIGREQEAIEWLERALAADPDAPAEMLAENNRHLAVAYAQTGRLDASHQALADANRLWPYATVRSQFPQDYTSERAVAQTRRYQEGLRLAGLRDHASEDADFGAASDGKLLRGVAGYSPTAAPGVTTIRTADLPPFLGRFKPLVIDTVSNFWGRSIPGTVGLRGVGLGGDFSDRLQERLRRKMQVLTDGNISLPIVAVGWSSERFDGYNLALRLAALGYTKVFWYRGGRESWEANGLPETSLLPQDW